MELVIYCEPSVLLEQARDVWVQANQYVEEASGGRIASEQGMVASVLVISSLSLAVASVVRFCDAE